MTALSNLSPAPAVRQRIAWILLVFLILASAGELAWRGFRRAPSDFQDFAIIYASLRAFHTGNNPYDPSALRAAAVQSGNVQQSDPNPQNLATYLPTTYLLLSPLAALDWSQARWAWIFVDFVAVVLLLLALTRYGPVRLPPWKTAFAVVFILGFGPIHTAIAKGQFAVLLTALLALALAAESRHHATLAAVLIALAACLKPQVVAPVVLLYFLQKRWKAIATIAAICSGILAIAWVWLASIGVSWIDSLLHNVRFEMQPHGVYDPSPTNPLSFQLVNASPFFHLLIGNQEIITIVLTAIAIAVLFLLLKVSQVSNDILADPLAFGGACVWGLVFLTQRYYDAAVLVFVVVWALNDLSTTRRIPALISIAGCIIMAFPLPAFLVSSGYSSAPGPIPQKFWDAVVIHQQSWVLLIVLAAIMIALANRSRPQRFNSAIA